MRVVECRFCETRIEIDGATIQLVCPSCGRVQSPNPESLRSRVREVRRERRDMNSLQINALRLNPEMLDLSRLRHLPERSVAAVTGIPPEGLQIDLRFRVKARRRVALNERRAKQ